MAGCSSNPAAPTQTAAAPDATAPGPAHDPDAVHEHHYHPPASAITSTTFTVPAGSEISVRTEETIDSAQAVEGQTYAAEVTQDVRDESGKCVIPRGANAQVVIVSAAKGGHFRGASDLVLDLGSVSVDGRRYSVTTDTIAERGHEGVGANKRTLEMAGGGAAIGSIIGAIAGHGKGAAIGAGAGAGGGALAEILTKGSSIKVPAETVMTFRLERPLRIVEGQ
ncbi:MAG TPA: hypothetical protein VKX45_08910 [Bryobacteraceae bacterium]|nr:hypothetical protein [Bryobacteraceae bacterium]